MRGEKQQNNNNHFTFSISDLSVFPIPTLTLALFSTLTFLQVFVFIEKWEDLATENTLLDIFFHIFFPLVSAELGFPYGRQISLSKPLLFAFMF